MPVLLVTLKMVFNDLDNYLLLTKQKYMKNAQLDRQFFSGLKKKYSAYNSERQELIKVSSDALTSAKEAIFAFHRGGMEEGSTRLRSCIQFLGKAALKFKAIPELSSEGSYRAALEEFVEASLFEKFLQKKQIGEVKAPGLDEDVYLGGLFDMTGELVRYAVLKATERNYKEMERAYDVLKTVSGEIISMNITGALRSKYDQLKQSVRKMEEIRYDLSLRK